MRILHSSDWHLGRTFESYDLEGGRTVGVISHVEELKRALPTGISVVSRDHESTMDVSHPGGNDG